VIPYPEAGWQLLVPVPLGLSAGSLQTWATWGLLVAGALVTGRFLTWLYRLIPANG
jgi:hypothetical protein